jgi:hypothetical protein
VYYPPSPTQHAHDGYRNSRTKEPLPSALGRMECPLGPDESFERQARPWVTVTVRNGLTPGGGWGGGLCSALLTSRSDASPLGCERQGCLGKLEASLRRCQCPKPTSSEQKASPLLLFPLRSFGPSLLLSSKHGLPNQSVALAPASSAKRSRTRNSQRIGGEELRAAGSPPWLSPMYLTHTPLFSSDQHSCLFES